MRPAENFYETIKENPDEIIAWAKREIEEYKNLIKIIEKAKGTSAKKPPSKKS